MNEDTGFIVLYVHCSLCWGCRRSRFTLSRFFVVHSKRHCGCFRLIFGGSHPDFPSTMNVNESIDEIKGMETATPTLNNECSRNGGLVKHVVNAIHCDAMMYEIVNCAI